MREGRRSRRQLTSRVCLGLAVACAYLSPMTVQVALAATVVQNITVSLTLQADCKIQATTNMSFGVNGVIDTNRDTTSTMDIQCTDTTPYTISLNAGSGAGATTTLRKLTSGGNTADYALYRNAGRTQTWGTSIGVDTVRAPVTAPSSCTPFTAACRRRPRRRPGPTPTPSRSR